MSAAHVTAQEMSNLYTNIYCIYAACAILIYDWLVCLGQEVRFIWNWHSKVTGSSLVYALSRYAVLIQSLLIVVTNYPMSDRSCTANVWAQNVAAILGGIAFSAFSAMRAYALSNRNIWLTAVIILLALPPAATLILECLYETPTNLPSPFNCSWSAPLTPTLSLTITVVMRASQFTAELLVVGITWWYSYQSYRIRKGINLGKTVSSLLIYNGSLYFLCASLRKYDPLIPRPHRKICRFLATLYILNIIFSTASVPIAVLNAGNLLASVFYDPITSILVCHFMLSVRQFDSNIASATYSGTGSQPLEHMVSTADVLQFTARPSNSLPAFIASFAQPVHVDSSLSGETDTDEIVDDGSEWRETDVLVSTQEIPARQTRSLAADQPSDLEHSA